MNNYHIAIITDGFGGTTLPLAKYFAEKGCDVDYYAGTGIGKFRPFEATDGISFDTLMGIHPIPCEYFNSLSSYLGKNVKLWYVKCQRPYTHVPLVRRIMYLIRFFQYKRICSTINTHNYDLIILVAQYFTPQFIFYHKFLNGKKVTILHEVVNHLNPDYLHPSKLMRYLFEKKSDIVVHSQNSYNDILKYKEVDKSLIHHINFGIFETFNTIKVYNQLNLPQKYLLFFGAIKPYKGLSVLYKAIQEHPECLNGYKIVVAGSGSDSSLPLIANNTNFYLLNRFITNNEVVELARNAYAIICPYLSVSQSGIPQTMYVFGKPLITSDLFGFREIVRDGVNGLLFKTGDSDCLSKKIFEITSNEQLYTRLVERVNSFDKDFPDYSWSKIVNQYIQLIEQ